MRSKDMDLSPSNYFPSQWEFLTNKKKARIKTFCGGMGSGKTHSFLAETFINLVTKKDKSGKSNGLVLYPTYGLAESVFVEPFKDILDRNGILYTYNISAHRFKTVYGDVQIYQTRYPQRIVGASYTYCGIDELDIETFKIAKITVQKALGRLRGCDDAVLYITTTPEGFGYTWHLMVEKYDDNKLLVHGKTTDNPYLPDSYIQSLRDNYDEKLLKAYLDGEFVNLQQGQTYHAFNREKNVKECKYNKRLPIRVGMDYNVSPLATVLWQKYNSKPQIQVFDAISLSHSGDGDLLTERMCQTIKEKYPNNKYMAYPDATGAGRHSSARFSDIGLVKQAGFDVKVKHVNPLVVNRVNSMNKALCGNMIIDPSCKDLINDLEQTTNKPNTREIDKSNPMRSHLTDALGYSVDWCFPSVRPKLWSIDR